MGVAEKLEPRTTSDKKNLNQQPLEFFFRVKEY